MKTYMAKASDQQNRAWHVVDAKDQVLGRLSTKLARILQGKHKPTYTPHIDMGDFVVVINADQVRVTGRKAEQKTYPYYTGWRGGLKERTFGDMIQRNPDRAQDALERAEPFYEGDEAGIGWVLAASDARDLERLEAVAGNLFTGPFVSSPFRHALLGVIENPRAAPRALRTFEDRPDDART